MIAPMIVGSDRQVFMYRNSNAINFFSLSSYLNFLMSQYFQTVLATLILMVFFFFLFVFLLFIYFIYFIGILF